jgi:hypothetical protein
MAVIHSQPLQSSRGDSFRGKPPSLRSKHRGASHSSPRAEVAILDMFKFHAVHRSRARNLFPPRASRATIVGDPRFPSRDQRGEREGPSCVRSLQARTPAFPSRISERREMQLKFNHVTGWIILHQRLGAFSFVLASTPNFRYFRDEIDLCGLPRGRKFEN